MRAPQARRKWERATGTSALVNEQRVTRQKGFASTASSCREEARRCAGSDNRAVCPELLHPRRQRNENFIRSTGCRKSRRSPRRQPIGHGIGVAREL
jgi:hypothetical protein